MGTLTWGGELARTTQDVELIRWVSPLQNQTHHLCCHCHHPHSPLFPVVIITGSHRFADMGMVMHGLCTGDEVGQATGTDEAKVVVCSLEVIHYCSFILTLFAALGAESQATSPS